MGWPWKERLVIRVDFSVPVDFEAIPIGADFETTWTELNRRYARPSMTGDLDQQKLGQMARALHQVSCFLKEVGVVYAADCLHLFQGEPSLGSLAVAVVDFPYGGVTQPQRLVELCRVSWSQESRGGPVPSLTRRVVRQPYSQVARATRCRRSSHRMVRLLMYSPPSSMP